MKPQRGGREHIREIFKRVFAELEEQYRKEISGRPLASIGGAPITPRPASRYRRTKLKNQIQTHFKGNYLPFYSKYLPQPKRIGGQEFQALCPFHQTRRQIACHLKISPGYVSRLKTALSIAKCNAVSLSTQKIQQREFKVLDRILKMDEITYDNLDDFKSRKADAKQAKDEAKWLQLSAAELPWVQEGRKAIGQWADIQRTLLIRAELELFKKTIYKAADKMGEKYPEAKDEFYRILREESLVEGIFRASEPSI